MAYLVELNMKCQAGHCERQAKQELRSWRNEKVGVFCTPHAKAFLKEWQKTEADLRDGGRIS